MTTAAAITSVAQAVFNVEACSDLVLVVNGARRFYAQRAVLVPQSEYLQTMVTWPPEAAAAADDDDDDGRSEPDVALIELPEIDLPLDDDNAAADPDPADWFETYLRFAYGLYDPAAATATAAELLAVFQIADFMLAPDAHLAQLDERLAALDLADGRIAPMLVFCQAHRRLRRTLAALSARAAAVADAGLLLGDRRLLALAPDLFADIVAASAGDAGWFWAVVCYAARTVPAAANAVHIDDPDLVVLFHDLIATISARWTMDVLVEVCRRLERTRVVCDGLGADPTFLTRTLAAAVVRLGTCKRSRSSP